MTRIDTGAPKLPSIEWVNHAGFVLRGAQCAVLVDPWLSGSAFNDGWDLLVPSKFTPADVARISHIWISHEHPDHFAPTALKQIPQEVRAETEILFQVTRDHRVVDFCRSLGFAVRELRDLKRYELAPGFTVMIGRRDTYDSWLFCEIDGRRVLDLNDCIIHRRSDLQKLGSQVGDVDVLLTQFSYANWIGGPDQPQLREAAAAERLRLMTQQLESLRARWCIPSASFSFFSHEENFYLNDRRNSVDDAVAVIESAGVNAVTLFPGDVWRIGSDHDSRPALEKYRRAFDVEGRERHHAASVSMDELIELGARYAERLRAKNSALGLRLVRLPPLRYGKTIVVYLSDHDRSVRFDPFDGIRVVDAPTRAIVMASDSLAFCLRFEFGSDTLFVNGRFSTATRSDYSQLFSSFAIGAVNNSGRQASPRLFLEKALLVRVLKRLCRIGRKRRQRAS